MLWRMKYMAVLPLVFLAGANLLPADTLLDDFQVNTELPGHPPQTSPFAVADWNSETIYITWLSQWEGDHWDVAFNRYNYDLEPLEDAIYINIRQGTYDCAQARLALSPAGFGAAWIEEEAPQRVMFRSYDGNGNPFSDPVSVAEQYPPIRKDANISGLGNGYLIVWYDERDESKIWAQKVDFDGNLIGDNFQVRPDSSGVVIGLEAQNHPDGRTLVSWVDDSLYSRARWYDNTGNPTGDVFDMADPYVDLRIIKSLVRFESGGDGILYQYSNTQEGDPWNYGRYCYVTYLDQDAHQVGDRVRLFAWQGEWNEGSSYSDHAYSFPDVISLSDNQYISIRYFHTDGYAMGGFFWDETYNKLYSSVYGDYIVPWGLVGEGGYDLCQLNNDTFLYCFDLETLGMRTYEIATLDSSTAIEWVGEPAFGQAQDRPEISVQNDGSFRVVYRSQAGSQGYAYTRHFSSDGTPSGPDEMISLNQELSPVLTERGRLVHVDNDDDLIVWASSGDIYGTEFSGATWSNEIEHYDTAPEISLQCQPNLGANSAGDWMLMWSYSYLWGGELPVTELHCQPFNASFGSLYPSFSPTGILWITFNYPKSGFDVALRDDGRFLVCWNFDDEGSYMPWITVKSGTEYHTLNEGSITFLSPSDNWSISPPSLDKSPTGYWIAWSSGSRVDPETNRVFLAQFDADGNQIGEPQMIDEEEACPVVGIIFYVIEEHTLNLAVSSTGNFAVVWQDARFDEGDLFCRQFNPDGSFYGREYRVNSDPVGPLQKEPAVAFGPEDRLYFTWTDFRNVDGQGDIYCKVIEWEDATAVENDPEPLPFDFALYKPFPNPFNSSTVIGFELPVAGYVDLKVFDVNGRNVGAFRETHAANRWYPAGIHHILFDGTGLSSGVYLVQMEAGEYRQNQKMILLK